MGRVTTKLRAVGLPRIGDDSGTINQRWRPTECPVCFTEAIAVWKTGEGFDCHCAEAECGHIWVERYKRYWR